jgi:thiol-disulfide isomerase/thioredoxin
MNTITLGPLVFSAERVALLAGVLLLLVTGEWLSRRVDQRFGVWVMATLAAALAGARCGYILRHTSAFAAEPWSALAIWDGGLAWRWAAAPVALATILVLRRPRLIGIAVAVLVICVSLTAGLAELSGRVARKSLPALSLQALDREIIHLADTAGRPTVINLWATWCPPCLSELPMLALAAREHPEVRFIFADQGEPGPKVREHLRRKGLSLPMVALDTDQALAKHYAAAGLPATLVIRRDGSLAAAHLGQISRDTLEHDLDAFKP